MGQIRMPTNRLKHPIERLIEKLKELPLGSTYEEEDLEFFGGETKDAELGTGWSVRLNIVEGFNPPRT